MTNVNLSNEEKAKEIANDETLYGEDPDENSKIEECYIAAMAMAKYKDDCYADMNRRLIEQGHTIDTLKKNLAFCDELIDRLGRELKESNALIAWLQQAKQSK